MIYERVCPVCGTAFKTERETQVYCRRACVNKGRPSNNRGNYDTSLEWTRVDGRWECPYSVEVSCTVRNCDKCGWNPEVAAARTKAFMEKYNN